MLDIAPPQIDIDLLQQTQGETLASLSSELQTISIIEQDNLRWMRFQDGSIQSVMLLQEPAYPVLDYTQALLSSLILIDNPGSLLNLGLGSGSIERFILSQLPEMKLCSVEIDSNIIELAREHFHLPATHPVIQASAEKYLAENNQKFDIIVCDIYSKTVSDNPILNQGFIEDVARSLNSKGVLALNCLPTTEAEMVDILVSIRTCFPWVMLLDVKAQKNIVVICTKRAFISGSDLTSRMESLSQSTGLNLSKICQQLIRLPVSPQYKRHDD
ncbi:MAG: fused MFS/spermidine synthase [Candidatus Thiodiazotropha sp. (ex Myrtea spinifera)]|nr:fused MFS/spermidine synthase [Candidatus Thiodiazotropha sp. (ex Myrtea spinifera)]MCU7829737.1 fused MFS/spermidine synthase [Candidatus Thiodiazotropha sp. (ex Myrtea sp. 'scaly one' KF741663)]